MSKRKQLTLSYCKKRKEDSHVETCSNTEPEQDSCDQEHFSEVTGPTALSAQHDQEHQSEHISNYSLHAELLIWPRLLGDKTYSYIQLS